MTPGTLAIYLSATLAVVAFVASIRWARGHEGSETAFRMAYHGMTLALALASVFLLLAILTHDFRFRYVIGYSSRDLPLIYLISAFWGGQQGTYLLWALMGALIGYPLFRKGAWEPGAVMACYLPTVGFMIGLMLDPEGNPFRVALQVPPDGRGLNPLLQDPWMASHPPLVFAGYAAMTVPAVLALVALLKREERGWLDPALRWSLVSFVSLGAGIVTGGFWAYRVLGWGGYWGWDPVENASLVPWIVVAALLHGVLVQRATGALAKTNLILALAGYFTVFYATFLTRSGVLADFSVHSFPAGTIYRYLVAILVIIAGVSIFALARRKGEQGTPVRTSFAWPFALSVTIAALAVSAAFVLFGTSWPILSSLAGKPAVPGASFYNRVSLPLYVFLLAVLGVAPFLSWGGVPWKAWIRRYAIAASVGLAGTAGAALSGGHGIAFLLLFFTALVALASNAIRLVGVMRLRPLNSGAAVAHIGFALMFVGIVASSAWGSGAEVRLPLGQPTDSQGVTLTYRGHVDDSAPKDRWRVAAVRPGGKEETAEVTMYRLPSNGYQKEESVFRKPAILRGWTGDVYLAPANLEFGSSGEHTIDLVREKPVRHGGVTFTFLRFDARGMDGDHPAVLAYVRVVHESREEELELPFTMAGDHAEGRPVTASLLPGTTVTLRGIEVEQGMVRVAIAQAGSAGAPETLILEVSRKPLIGLLWTGVILLGVGCTIATVRRFRAPGESLPPARAPDLVVDRPPPGAARQAPAARGEAASRRSR